MTKQAVSGPRNTHSHHLAGPSPSRGAKTRHVVSSACRCHEPRDRAVIASSSGTSSVPACAHAPASVPGETSAPCRASPVTSEFMLRPAANRSVNSNARNALVKRPLPIAFGGPGAVTVAGTGQSQARRYRRRQSARTRTTTSQSSCSVDMIAAQARERRPALRAAVPAAREIPDHLDPGQVRVIPPPGPRPRAALLPRAGPGTLPAGAGRRRHCPAAPGATAPTTARTPSAAIPPGQRAASPARRLPRVLRPQPRVLLAQLRRPAAPAHGSPPAPQPARPAAMPQHPPNPGQRQPPQPSRSTANTLSSRKSRTPHPRVAAPSVDANAPSHDFRITRGVPAGQRSRRSGRQGIHGLDARGCGSACNPQNANRVLGDP